MRLKNLYFALLILLGLALVGVAQAREVDASQGLAAPDSQTRLAGAVFKNGVLVGQTWEIDNDGDNSDDDNSDDDNSGDDDSDDDDSDDDDSGDDDSGDDD